MAVSLPNSPNLGDLFSLGDKVWRWSGNSWASHPYITIIGGDAFDVSEEVVSGGTSNV